MPYTLGPAGQPAPAGPARRERLTPILGAPPSLLNLPPGCPFTPRCPLAQDVCDEEEPELTATDEPGHLAACHFHDELVGSSQRPADVVPRPRSPTPTALGATSSSAQTRRTCENRDRAQ